MDSVSPRNAEFRGISWVDPQKVGTLLIEVGKTSRKLREIVVKALVRPASYHVPQVELQSLLRAFTVTDFAASEVWQHRSGDLAAFDRWKRVNSLLLAWARHLMLAKPKFVKKDVRYVKFLLGKYKACRKEMVDFDWKLVEKDLDLIEEKAWAEWPKGPKRRGRTMTEHQVRIITAVEYLRQCGAPRACETVAEALWSWGVKREAKTISNLWGRYKSGRWRWPERAALPRQFPYLVAMAVAPQIDGCIQERIAKAKGALKVATLDTPSKPRRRSG
jgi:hypothetical protein